jgi:hypothetical protein
LATACGMCGPPSPDGRLALDSTVAIRIVFFVAVEALWQYLSATDAATSAVDQIATATPRLPEVAVSVTVPFGPG